MSGLERGGRNGELVITENEVYDEIQVPRIQGTVRVGLFTVSRPWKRTNTFTWASLCENSADSCHSGIYGCPRLIRNVH
jgi:hypothetical protein